MVVTAHQSSPRAATPAAAWDSEVFVLRGDTRDDLRDRVLSLSVAVENPPVALDRTAAGLAAELQPGGSRLAVVASSADDLAKKLRRAAERLADPKCKQIRDTNGQLLKFGFFEFLRVGIVSFLVIEAVAIGYGVWAIA